jgi:methylenetetrahydrofolate dehydrogenase (NADP+)/methenyltetrahydrofolate cyclohydrolase
MTAKILDGRAIARAKAQELKAEVAALKEEGVTPGLAVVLCGDDPASQIYVRSKHKRAASLGIDTFDHQPPADASQEELMRLVGELNEDPRVHGFIVQMPLPDHLDADQVLDAIRPDKDVDGFHPHNLGLLAQNRPQFVAATPKGCMTLIEESGIDLSGKDAVVVGRSNIVGKPMSLLLTNANCTVTVCHSRTRDLEQHVKRADIVVAAVGRAELIRGDWIKEGAVVIDVGITRTEDGKLLGDVEFEAAAERAAAITPVPGGVGPMTILTLLANTVQAAKASLE